MIEIVHVVRQYAPSVGGLEDAVSNLCRQQAKQPNVHVRVVTLNRVFTDPSVLLPPHEVIDGIDVTRISYHGSSRYPIAPAVLNVIKSADIVHVHAIDFFFDFLAWTKVFHRKTLIASTHGGFFHTAFAARLKRIYFQTITRLSCVAYHTICASSENDALTFGQIATHKVVTIENGVNIKKWHDGASVRPVRTLLFIGRWSDNKRVPMLIDLLAELCAINASWRLIIAGINGHETVDSLRAHAQSRGVDKSCDIHEHPSEQELKQLIGQASYIASASSYEGFGLTAIEGLSAGLVPVLSPLPPFKKVLDLLGFGVCLDPQDLSASAYTMEQAHLAFEAQASTLRARCLAMAQKYAWPDVSARFMDVVKAAMASQPVK